MSRHSRGSMMIDGEIELHHSKADASSPTVVVRRVALLLDGMSRAAILPFGPRLVHRLTYDKEWTELDASSWSEIAYPIAVVTGSYALGRALGIAMAGHFPVAQSVLPQQVSRLGGLSLALHIFAFGAGLSSVHFLVWIRFISGVLAGYACSITNCMLPEDKVHAVVQEEVSDDELMEEGSLRSPEDSSRTRKCAAYGDVAPGTTKVYMTGVAISILAGGLLYKIVNDSIAMQAYTGGEAFTLSPVFFVGVWLLVICVLRCVFSFTLGSVTPHFEGTSPREERHGAVHRLVNRVVHRRIKTALSPNPSMDDGDRDFAEPLSSSRHHENNSFHGFSPSRARLGSARSETSLREFFDCNSAFSDEVIDLDADPLTGDWGHSSSHEPSETEVVVYEDRQSLYPDGSPAFVPQGECIATVPPKYLVACHDNHDKARKMWIATQQWRRENDVWRIHRIPHPLFTDIKQAYPHFLHGHSKQGFPIIYEQPGRMNLKEFFRNGGQISEMVRHYTFMMEYIANCVVTREELRKQSGNASGSFDPSHWGTMVVMDVKGATVTSLSGDVVKYLKQAGDINNCHYPMRLQRAFVVNSPFWLAGVWSSIKGILPESVHVEILSASKYLDCLHDFIDDDQIPPEYGGSSPYPLGQHPYEVALNEMVSKASEVDDIDDHPAAEITARNVDSTTVLCDEAWSQDTTISVPAMKAPTSHPLRRRTSSHDASIRRSIGRFPSTIAEEDYEAGEMGSGGWERGILLILSAMYVIWCAVQGAIEVAVPLWVLSPAQLGGLGYAPSRCGVAMFSASVVLLWIMRTKVVGMVSQMPNKEPMRAFRVGVGSVTVLLILLPLVPHYVTSVARTESVLIMTSTIIFLSCMAVASMLARSAATILHRIASDTFAAKTGGELHWFARFYGQGKLLSDCESGRFTSRLRLLGEIVGVVAVAPLYSWSTLHHRPFPFDGSCCFYTASLIAFVLYVLSFSLHLNSAGKFAPHPRDGCSDVDTRKCCSFVGEVFTVVVGDMASLFEEENWSTSPLLGYPNSRGAKDKSAVEQNPAGGYGVKTI